jgi:hypothetical protein
MKSVILGVEGVTHAFDNLGATTFHVYVDERYDLTSVAYNIVEAIRKNHTGPFASSVNIKSGGTNRFSVK